MYRYSMHTGPAVIQTRKIFVHYCARLHAIRYLQAVLSTHHTVVKFITLLTRVYSHTVHGPRLVRTTYWPRLVDHLSQPGHGAIAKQVVCTLSAVAHYGAAGEIVLRRSRCHPALHSAAAQRTVLKRYLLRQGRGDLVPR